MSEQDDRTEEPIGLHNLKPAPGSRKARKRVGRGEGSGTGKTSGRGQKGAGSRSGSKSRANFEGGQMPIHMRMRKLRGISVNQVLGLQGRAAANGAAEDVTEADAEAPAADADAALAAEGGDTA